MQALRATQEVQASVKTMNNHSDSIQMKLHQNYMKMQSEEEKIASQLHPLKGSKLKLVNQVICYVQREYYSKLSRPIKKYL